MTDELVLAAIVDRTALALTAYGEARGIPRDDPKSHSPVEELLAVMCVCRNRVAGRRGGTTATTLPYRAVCLAPDQFSSWNPGTDANHLAVMEQARRLVSPPDPAAPVDPEVRECLALADAVIAGSIIDRTGGATSYYAPAAMVPPGRVPSWAVGKRFIEIGDQYFIQP